MNLTNLKVGSAYLLTVRYWFYGPDGALYNAVFGTIKKSTTGDVLIGNMVIDRDQVFAGVATKDADFGMYMREMEHNGILTSRPESNSRIYNADVEKTLRVL